MRTHVVFAVAGLMAATVARAEVMPAGWRAATPADAIADFDGDGRADRAAVLVKEKAARLGVFVFRGSGGAARNIEVESIDGPVNIGLDTLPAGKFPTACGRGSGFADAPCRPSITIKEPAVSITHYEMSQEIVFWNGRRFERVFLSD